MRIRSHSTGIYVAMTCAGVMALTLPGLLVYLKWAAGEGSPFLYVAMLPFLLVGAALFVFGLRGTATGLLGGGWELDVPGPGGTIGTPLSTTLFPPRPVQVDGELSCQLRAVSRSDRGGGRIEMQTLWKTQWTQPAATVHPSTGISIVLPLPSEGPSTRESANGAQYTRWQLNVSVPSGGSEQELVFDVPVYGGGDATRLPL